MIKIVISCSMFWYTDFCKLEIGQKLNMKMWNMIKINVWRPVFQVCCKLHTLCNECKWCRIRQLNSGTPGRKPQILIFWCFIIFYTFKNIMLYKLTFKYLSLASVKHQMFCRNQCKLTPNFFTYPAHRKPFCSLIITWPHHDLMCQSKKFSEHSAESGFGELR